MLAAMMMVVSPLAQADPTASPSDQNSAQAQPQDGATDQTETTEDVSGRAGETPTEGSEPLENVETAEAVVTETNSAGLVTSTTVENPSDEFTVKDPDNDPSTPSEAPREGTGADETPVPSAEPEQGGSTAAADESAEPGDGSPQPSSTPPIPAGAPTSDDGTTVLEDIQTDSAGGFSMVGVTWDILSGDDLGLHIRTLTADGWSEWYEVTPDQEETEQKATGVIYVEDSTAVEVQATGAVGARAEGMRAVLIDTPAQSSDPSAASAAAAVNGETTTGTVLATSGFVPQPNMITRSRWGAMAQDGCEANSDTIKAVAVHHTAGSNNYSSGQSASIVRGIQYYHEVTLGWCDIGYNFLVDQYGQIFEGKGGGPTFPVHGAHASTWNWQTVGVSLMMNSNTAQPSNAMLNSLEDLIAWKIANNYLNPLGTVTLGGKRINVIFRHGDVMSTECPGTNVTRRMSEIRNAVASRVQGKTYSTIYDTWQANGGAGGRYGVVYEMEHGVSGGRQTNFARGSIYAATDGTIFTVANGIGDKYAALGYEHGTLGVPTGPEICGIKDGGCYQKFQGGAILWSNATGAHISIGAIRTKWAEYRYENGTLGYPTTDEICGIKDGGCYQKYQGGAILWSNATGAHISIGAIRTKWAEYDYERGQLGYPTTDELATGSGVYQLFQGGAIIWSSTTGAHISVGAIRTKWAEYDYERGRLGYPTTDEICGIKDGGCYQKFQGGAILWSNATGAHISIGAIRTKWAEYRYENGTLGYPTTDEICTIKDGGCYQKYQGGAILWTPTTGAHISIGAIRSAWAATGYENGQLGYPTSDELATESGVYQRFQGGAIYWTASTNATKVITVNGSGLTSAQKSYLQAALPAAIAESQQYGVPVSVALGQSILESGWGGSTLSSRYNNYFGIKCSTSSPYQAGCVNMNSGEYVNSSYQILSSSFRTYSSPTDSFLDHGYFLTHNSRYRNAFNHTKNPDEFIRQVASAGYATDPNYAQKVINIMTSYGLYQYNI
ncbi:hypothetical protein D7U36_09270 [Propionibacterium australiense]|uniref:N-acetylmuramoyl-L-alanine amidase n=2 Tax=Propionibacterium australiense TaxID=119981 RepID=A0A8B3FKV7_9ACTN|nr:hypothetical protein D7U36_09270 [Propionibacterium australiense]